MIRERSTAPETVYLHEMSIVRTIDDPGYLNLLRFSEDESSQADRPFCSTLGYC